MEIKIKNWDNCPAIRLNKNILSLLKVEIGVSLNAQIKKGALILTPAELTDTLGQLLVNSTASILPTTAPGNNTASSAILSEEDIVAIVDERLVSVTKQKGR